MGESIYRPGDVYYLSVRRDVRRNSQDFARSPSGPAIGRFILAIRLSIVGRLSFLIVTIGILIILLLIFINFTPDVNTVKTVRLKTNFNVG